MTKFYDRLRPTKKLWMCFCSALTVTFMLTAAPLYAQEQPASKVAAGEVGKIAATEPKLVTMSPITAGAALKEYYWETAKGPAEIWVTEIDLSNPYIELGVINGKGKLTERLNVTAMARNSGAVAAINGDFYNLKGEGVPIGPVASGGRLAASPAKLAGWHALGITADRRAYIDSFTFSGSVKAPNGVGFQLAGLNKTAYWEQPEGNHSHVDQLHLYNDLWGGTTRGEDSYTTPTEILVKDGKVVDISEGKYFDFPVPKGTYILRGHGKATQFLLNNFRIGAPIDIEYDISPNRNWSTILGGYSLLVDGGKRASIPNEVLTSLDGLRARSAAGISKDGKTIYLVAVEGRTNSSKGLSLGNLASFFEQLGAWRAVNLDGGGSTTMAARPLGDRQAQRVFSPEQGGNERMVVNALGVYSTAPQGELQGLIISGHQVALIGEEVTFSLAAYDRYFNPLDVKKLPVVWNKSGEVGTLEAHRFMAKRPGTVEIVAGVNQVTARQALEVVSRRELSQLNLNLAKNNEQITLGQKVPLALTLETTTGKTRQIPTSLVDWQFHNLKGEVSADGTLTIKEAVSSGTGVLVARYQGFSAPLALTVRKAVPLALLDSLRELSFASFPQEVMGRISQVPNPIKPQASPVISLEYDFTRVDEGTSAAAYLKLGKGGFPIDQEAKSLTLDIYGSGGNQWLRAELVDAAGNIQRVDLAKRVDWRGWQSVELDFGSLNYIKPVTLQRVYVVSYGNEQEQRLPQGSILLNNLTLNYNREISTAPERELSLRMTVGQKQMTVNDTAIEMDVAPVIVSGRTLVPVRFVSQALNGTVLWDGATQNVTVIQRDNWIDLWLGDRQMVVNGKAISLEVPPELKSNRSMLPLRAVAEMLGLTVQWNPETRSITLSS